MLFLLCIYMMVKAAVDTLPQGPPVPAGVKIRFAGTADIRQLTRSDRGHRVLRNAELPYVLIVRLTTGRYVIFVSPDAILPVPRIMVLSSSTVYIVSELALTLRWAHSTANTLNWYEARIPGPDSEPFEEFVGCFQMNYESALNYESAPRDTGVDDEIDAYEIAHIYNRFEDCIMWGSFEDNTTWAHVREAYWRYRSNDTGHCLRLGSLTLSSGELSIALGPSFLLSTWKEGVPAGAIRPTCGSKAHGRRASLLAAKKRDVAGSGKRRGRRTIGRTMAQASDASKFIGVMYVYERRSVPPGHLRPLLGHACKRTGDHGRSSYRTPFRVLPPVRPSRELHARCPVLFACDRKCGVLGSATCCPEAQKGRGLARRAYWRGSLLVRVAPRSA
ncbi:uncharacterized protein B0H18DRAFT_955875 [Fomitopsis serialis]|uniref:uncharacterized protein n=1 Tax=Fomitopsis serialis TaxID=139415 RepID=UPI00200733E9|nr:uncharacterized protein B0H18DRAFT_955875 [Neoantrodia serialis]KAH9923318.1 hypothetical protein B0H18DRAFT_955875 [Neoantrodia serialis]